MNVHFIGDTHLNHDNIIDYCNRPYRNITEMNEDLIKKWNNTVKKNDIVFHLGDVYLGSKDGLKNIVQRLNGRKFLIKGNHDCWSNQVYLDAGFEKVYDYPIIYKDFYLLSHEPMFMTPNMPYVNIFAHVHNNPQYSDYSKSHFCVSCERKDVNFKPISFNKIKKIILESLNQTIDKIYLAGPFFTPEQRKNIKNIAKILREKYSVFVPMEHFIENGETLPNDEWGYKVFYMDKTAIDDCDMVVALDYGFTSDAGTAWEIGYAYASRKPVSVISMTSKTEPHSLMLINGCTNFFDSIEDFLSNNISSITEQK